MKELQINLASALKKRERARPKPRKMSILTTSTSHFLQPPSLSAKLVVSNIVLVLTGSFTQSWISCSCQVCACLRVFFFFFSTRVVLVNLLTSISFISLDTGLASEVLQAWQVLITCQQTALHRGRNGRSVQSDTRRKCHKLNQYVIYTSNSFHTVLTCLYPSTLT